VDENKYNEQVSCLMRVKHKNIVRFLGYCADTQADVRERLLCFEFVHNGTLKDHIKGTIILFCLMFLSIFIIYVGCYLVQAFPHM
jgi:serine/threonine protein kinase